VDREGNDRASNGYLSTNGKSSELYFIEDIRGGLGFLIFKL
jgi:hypothetical protein